MHDKKHIIVRMNGVEIEWGLLTKLSIIDQLAIQGLEFAGDAIDAPDNAYITINGLYARGQITAEERKEMFKQSTRAILKNVRKIPPIEPPDRALTRVEKTEVAIAELKESCEKEYVDIVSKGIIERKHLEEQLGDGLQKLEERVAKELKELEAKKKEGLDNLKAILKKQRSENRWWRLFWRG